ncbi:hypothetical protein DQ04_08521000, partial [Trypanosoma grayi]|uniref:hypothetical protein n=1 Tax=Trypanosoma grayi TaxID=71804 RepID=UPI0004F4AEEE
MLAGPESKPLDHRLSASDEVHASLSGVGRGISAVYTCAMSSGEGIINNYSQVAPLGPSSSSVDCFHVSSSSSSPNRIQMNGTVGQQQSGGWKVEQSQPMKTDRYVSTLEESHYTHTASTSSRISSKVVYVGTPLTPYTNSQGGPLTSGAPPVSSCSRAGAFSVVASTDYGNTNNATCTSSIMGEGSPPTGVPRQLMNINIGGSTGGGGGASASASAPGSNSLRMSNSMEVASWSPQGTPTVPGAPPLIFANYDGVVRLRTHPLRFKMLPSPVPYDIVFAGCPNDPPSKRLAHYQAIMLRWYQHIVVAQENVRARIRQRCPPPPESIQKLGVPPDATELQNWSTQCCRWWDETSRKRTRRGHRGGKTPTGGNGSRVSPQQQQ